MLYRVKLVGNAPGVLLERDVVVGKGVLGVSVLIPSLLLLASSYTLPSARPSLRKYFWEEENFYTPLGLPSRKKDALSILCARTVALKHPQEWTMNIASGS
jgi:hypothetical protein